MARCYLHLWWYFSHFVSILIYIDSFILVEARICKRFISISNCETFTNYQMYYLRKYLRPTLCLNKSLLLPKPSVLINLGTNDKFPGKFSELWQRYEQIEPFTPQAANIKQEPNVLYSNRYWWKCHLALTAKLKTRPNGLGRSASCILVLDLVYQG